MRTLDYSIYRTRPFLFGAVAIVMVFNVVAALVTNVDEVGIGTAALISLACLLIPIPVAWSLAP
jgi:hypothetical protein